MITVVRQKLQRNSSSKHTLVSSLFPCILYPSCASVVVHITCLYGDRTVLMQSSRQEQRAPQAGTSRSSDSSQPANLSRTQADAARSSDRQQSSAASPNSATSSHTDQDTSGSEASEQKEQQHQFFQEQQGQRAPAPTSASYSYGPAEQAEAKRQANKEAALTWLDKAKAAASNKDWTAAVSHPCKLCSQACVQSKRR